MDYTKFSDSTLKAMAAGQKLDYSKLSDAELHEIANGAGTPTPPTAEDFQPSMLGALGRGAAQGATFGTADELAGAAASPMGGVKQFLSDLGMDYTGDTDVAKYKKERDISRQRFEQSEQAYPKTTFLGNIGGAILPAILTGGESAVAEGGEALAGAAAKRGLLEGAGGAAATGAKYGAATGLGTSKAEDIGGLAKDVGASTLLGAGLGIAGQTAANTGMPQATAKYIGQKGKDIGSAFADLGPVKGIVGAFNAGLEGTRLFGEEARKVIQDKLNGIIQDLGSNLDDKAKDVLDQKLETLMTSPKSVDVQNWYDDFMKAVDRAENQNNDPVATPEFKRLRDIATNFVRGKEVAGPITEGETTLLQKNRVPVQVQNGQASPIAVDQLRRELANLSSASENSLKNPSARAIATTGVTGTEEEVTPFLQQLGFGPNAPGLKPMIEQAEPAVAPLNKTLSTINTAQEAMPTLSQALQSESMSTTGARARPIIKQLGQTLQGTEFEGAVPAIEKQAQLNELARKAGMKGLGTGFTHTLLGSVEAVGTTGANAAGLAAREAGNVITSVGKSLFSLAPQRFQELASKAASSVTDKASGEVAKVMQQASQKDNVGRNALMFTLMQNPAYREKIHDLIKDEPEYQGTANGSTSQ